MATFTVDREKRRVWISSRDMGGNLIEDNEVGLEWLRSLDRGSPGCGGFVGFNALMNCDVDQAIAMIELEGFSWKEKV